MKILVVGAAGMVGRKLVERLVRDRAMGGRTITEMTAVDVVAPSPPPAPFPIATEACDEPRTTAAPWAIIISSVTASVLGRP